MKEEKAAFLGRFQPLHLGHYKAIKSIRGRFNEVVIAIGSPQKSREEENPLSLNERKQLLGECFPQMEKVAVKDEDRGEEGYEDWAGRLIEQTKAGKIVTQNPLVQRIIKQYTNAEVVEQELHQPEKYSGTEIRERIRKGKNWRDLVPECSRGKTQEYKEIIKKSQ